MKKLPLIVMPLATSVLLWLAWPPLPFVLFLFVGLVPLLYIEDGVGKLSHPCLRLGIYVYVAFVLWNLLCTYWLFKTSPVAAIIIYLINPIFQTVPFILLHVSKKFISSSKGYFLFCCAWLSIEFFHQNWAFSFPFFTLGNGLSYYPQLMQLYEYTGVHGGSLWILVTNVVAYEAFRKITSPPVIPVTSILTTLLGPLLIIVIPAILSLAIFKFYEEKGKAVEVVVVHPNIDCRKEKYKVDGNELVMRYIKYTKTKISQNTNYVVWPETAITNTRWVHNIGEQDVIKLIRNQLLDEYPNIKLISGAILYEQIDPSTFQNRPQSPNARYDSTYKYWYNTYNSAIQVDNKSYGVPFRTKVKLVPFEETIPYAHFFALVRKVVGNLGGFAFETRRDNTNVMQSGNGIQVAPLICYESLFGNLANEYVGQGANLLFIILNEGWYKDITGASQFMYYSTVRAIENRRSIARSSNDGISCFVNQRGKLTKITDKFSGLAAIDTLYANRNRTIFSIFGNVIGNASLLITIILLLDMVKRMVKRTFSPK